VIKWPHELRWLGLGIEDPQLGAVHHRPRVQDDAGDHVGISSSWGGALHPALGVERLCAKHDASAVVTDDGGMLAWGAIGPPRGHGKWSEEGMMEALAGDHRDHVHEDEHEDEVKSEDSRG